MYKGIESLTKSLNQMVNVTAGLYRDTFASSIQTSIAYAAQGMTDSLAQAIKALSSLAEGNRLVGIISHVSELKDKIDKQIIVRKDKTGGSNITIVS